MTRPKPRRPLPEMQPHNPQASHHAHGAASERAWEEPNGIMAQCIAIGDHLVAAAKRTERALRAIGVALTDGEHQFDGPGPDQQADKAEYQRIAEAMFNNLTSDLFTMSAAARNADWHADDDADAYSEQMEPPRTEIDMDEHLSYLSDDDDHHSDVASASDMPLFADDVEAPSAPPSAPPSLPDTQQTTLADELEPEQEQEPAPLNAQQAVEEETLVAASVPTKKRGKKKKKRAAKAKRTELEPTAVDDVDQVQAEPTDMDLAPAQDACAPSVQTQEELAHDEYYENPSEQDGRGLDQHEPSPGRVWGLSDADVDEILDKRLRKPNLNKSQVKGLSIITGIYRSIRSLGELDDQTAMVVRQGLEEIFEASSSFDTVPNFKV